ncbi:MAG: serine/threonine protein kinase [Nitrosomonas sp. PRO4]|nr:serine/threonine protein kinase [Nitrosomonas sp. PRO4]
MTPLHDNVLPAGTQMGVYEIKDTMKVRAFDITYRAWNHHLKEWVKIQEYFPHAYAVRTNNGLGVKAKSESDQEHFDFGLKMFVEQAEFLTQIEHPNIVSAENVLQLNGTAYLIVAIQKGASLSKLAESPNVLAEAELKFILTSMLDAVQKIHEYKLMHGGIQPGAIFLGKDGEPRLTDFSAARLAIAGRAGQLIEQLAMGYAPVEQYDAKHEFAPATDFYALGATMYYCMTHHRPVAAQSRIMALSKGEPDPMNLSSDTAKGSPYSAQFLQAVNWMLQPEYSQRPQSADELLMLLKSEHGDSQDGRSPASKQAATKDMGSRNNLLWIGTVAGITVLIAGVLWLNQKPAELSVDNSAMLPAAPSIPHQTEAIAVAPEMQPRATIDNESDQVSASDKLAKIDPETMTEVEKRPSESAPIAAHTLTDTEKSEIDQQSVMIEPPLSQHQSVSTQEKTIASEVSKKYLVAAARAMRAERLTTPARDNAHKYYRAVLAAEPENAEALAGLQKIVNRYIQFINKAMLEGRINDARLYLERAESVLPGDAELLNIRAQLAD